MICMRAAWKFGKCTCQRFKLINISEKTTTLQRCGNNNKTATRTIKITASCCFQSGCLLCHHLDAWQHFFSFPLGSFVEILKQLLGVSLKNAKRLLKIHLTSIWDRGRCIKTTNKKPRAFPVNGPWSFHTLWWITSRFNELITWCRQMDAKRTKLFHWYARTHGKYASQMNSVLCNQCRTHIRTNCWQRLRSEHMI